MLRICHAGRVGEAPSKQEARPPGLAITTGVREGGKPSFEPSMIHRHNPPDHCPFSQADIQFAHFQQSGLSWIQRGFPKIKGNIAAQNTACPQADERKLQMGQRPPSWRWLGAAKLYISGSA